MLIEKNIYDYKNKLPSVKREEIITFLYKHLEQFRDSKKAIEEAILYALKEIPSFGGFVLTGSVSGQLVSVIVVNKTGMKNYIPENILVYIATADKMRGLGIGGQLIQYTLQKIDGSIALHVEPDNPAQFLYQKLGFEKKYLEMRYIKGK